MASPYHASDISELLSPEALATMSGLEFVQGMIAGRLPSPPIAKVLNFWIESASEGQVLFVGDPQFSSMNPIGSIHGGWFGTILDSCMGCAFQTTLPRGKGYTTLEFKVNILRPILPGSGRFRATGSVDHAGRRTGVVSGRLVGETDGKLYATGSTTCITLDLA